MNRWMARFGSWQLTALVLAGASVACGGDDPARSSAEPMLAAPTGANGGEPRSTETAPPARGTPAVPSAVDARLDSAGQAEASDDPDDADVIRAPLGPVPSGKTFTLTVNRLGTGTGSVSSSPLGIDCGTQCSAAFAEGTPVVLRARPQNGSDSLLGGWSLSSCAQRRDCTLPPIGVDQTVEVTFNPMLANVAFVNADIVPTNLGSARAYDAVCNASATRAGINNAAGDRFVAVISDAAESFRARLGASASGWVLPDGRPFAGSVEQLLDEQRVYNALDMTEQGGVHGPGLQRVLTNTVPDGTGPSTDLWCDDFTSLSGVFRGGEITGGPGAWIDFANYSCGRDTAFLYCMGRDRSAVVEPAATPGLRIWLSNDAYHPGAGEGTPDEFCRAGLPPGVVDARALIARTGSPASAVLDLASSYVRPDGVLVGTGSDLVAMFNIASGIWQRANGQYVPMVNTPDITLTTWTWTGSYDLTSLGLPESTCNDWTSATGRTITGGHFMKRSAFWYYTDQQDCGRPGGGYLYCVEPAPAP